jgi:hypothetical protein
VFTCRCGKEKSCVSHPGSQNFRAVIDQFAPKYQDAITKQEKMNVTKEIYDSLGCQSSRFLKYNAKAKGWEELSSLLARDKISHALRFANREKKDPSASTTTKPNTKKGHRRTGSESSSATVSTAATEELSLEGFENMVVDSEPLDWATSGEEEDEKPYAYEIPFDCLPSPAPVYSPQSYGPQYYHQPYVHTTQPYYHPHVYHPYHHHYGPAPQHHQQAQYAEPRYEEESYDDAPMACFPEKQAPDATTSEGSMDVDLTYIMSEPLIEWDMNTDSIYTVQDHR